MIAWSFSSYHIEKQLNVYYTLRVKSNWKVCKFIEIKICFWVCVILQLSGHNQFPTCNTKFVNLTVHSECLFSESRYFQIWSLRPINETFDGKIAWYHEVFQIITLQLRDKNFLKGYLESTVSKCSCQCLGFGDLSGKNNWKEITDSESFLQKLA